MTYLLGMSMSRKIILRITEQQFRSIGNFLLSEQKRTQKITKSSLIRRILNEYFDKSCRKEEMNKKSKIHEDNLVPKYPTRNNLKLTNLI